MHLHSICPPEPDNWSTIKRPYIMHNVITCIRLSFSRESVPSPLS